MLPPRALPDFRLDPSPSNDDRRRSFKTGNIGCAALLRPVSNFGKKGFAALLSSGRQSANNCDVLNNWTVRFAISSLKAALHCAAPTGLKSIGRKVTAIALKPNAISPTPSPAASTLPLVFSWLSIFYHRLCPIPFVSSAIRIHSLEWHSLEWGLLPTSIH